MTKIGVLVICVLAGSAMAETYKEQHQSELDKALKRLNEMCGTSITLAPIDWAAWEKASGKAQDCRPIIETVYEACRQDRADKPHPAGQAFVKASVKSLSCALLPDKGKSEEKVTFENGKISLSRVPMYSPTGDVPRLLYAHDAFAKVEDAKRAWDIENIDQPEATKKLQHCGDDMKLVIDIASWRQVGDGKLPTRLDIGEMCGIYASGVGNVCEEHKAAVRKKFDTFRCTYSKAVNGKATVAFKGKEIVVQSSTTIGFGDGAVVREAVAKKLGVKLKK